MDPWRKLGERVVYDSFRRIVRRTYQLPTGDRTDFEVFDLCDSAAVLALTAADEIVLVRQFRPGPEEFLLELPGGIVDPDQTPREAAQAELLEETGYRGELTSAGTIVKDGYATNTKHVFVARRCERVAEAELAELTEPVLVSIREFREHLRSGRLTDSDAGYRGLDFLGLL